ncbi:phosphatase PAP2 family protein [Bradyrhizobium arachidis]|uniref:phosphatase PAP2 family protein n=1 Tax=Bradyrhizobium arachidis TaxID=858423 RepID=UPI002162A2EB|nr:phosphatase PAP2 family protein [Bradyrhizobium arachidis]UVO27280.1 phosphatase PAP2 family protein [Bradyrhizobium arachidis]
MALVTVKPTRVDVAVADEISAHVSPGVEHAAQTLTWGADEHLLLAVSIAGWLYAHSRRPQAKPIANHLLAVSVVTTVLPHILKSVFDQTRPDRLTVRGHLRGIPRSGRARDAFPSGHATHMGALASAAGMLPSGRRHLARGLAVGLSLTRIALLAHWTSDVLAGFALGVTVERLLRPLTLRRPRRDRRLQ